MSLAFHRRLPVIGNLNGLGVFAAIVSSAADPLDVDILRTIWEKTLESTHARLTIGPIDDIIAHANADTVGNANYQAVLWKSRQQRRVPQINS